jgi:16S rRNA (adenine1518-N6/adenine1519-N6)-dimethyltransferase
VARVRKRFGQHFLHDPAVIERILRAIAPRAEDHLVEIGPGRGALTHGLLGLELASLDAIEIDRELAADLRASLAGDSRFHLHEMDALDLDLHSIAQQRGGKLRLVGNLPYNISTPLLFRFLDAVSCIEDMLFTLQREVVARIAAQPGTADYGRLTVMLAPRVRAQRLFDVGPGAFQPAPKVWSSVVRLIPFGQPPPFVPSSAYGEIVAAAFAHRRKTLRNALKGWLTAGDISACGIDPGARAETLAPRSFNELARRAEHRYGKASGASLG